MLEGVCKPLAEWEFLQPKTLLDVGGVCKWLTKLIVWRKKQLFKKKITKFPVWGNPHSKSLQKPMGALIWNFLASKN
jgi:hypothetical protein